MKATLSNYRQSPRKVAIVADLIRGKKVSVALSALRFTTKRATDPLEKLLRSAMANAKNAGIDNPEELFVNEISVNKGIILKRFMPRARGSSAPIWKRSSHVVISIGEKIGKGKKNDKAAEAVSEKAVKEAKPKKAAPVKAKKVTKK